MTEYELIDLTIGAQQTVVALGVAIVTQQVAYIVAIYLIGPKIRVVPLILLVVAYSLWLAGPIYGFFLAVERFMSLTNELHTSKGLEAAFVEGQYYANTIVYIIIWVLTLAYTVYVKRRVA